MPEEALALLELADIDFLVIFEMNFLHTSQATTPYLRACVTSLLLTAAEHTEQALGVRVPKIKS